MIGVLVFVFLFMKETKGIPLEKMDDLFGSKPVGDMEQGPEDPSQSAQPEDSGSKAESWHDETTRK